MESELWKRLYCLLWHEAMLKTARRRRVYSDAFILTVYFWSVLHDRPRCWACRIENWPASMAWLNLPSEATLSRRMRGVSVMLLLTALLDHLGALRQPSLLRKIDSKPLPVGGFSKDRDARRGYGAGQITRGYKLFCIWGDGIVPDAWTMGPMNLSDPAGATQLIGELSGSGYLVADVTHDSNPLHAVSASRGFQLLAPRKQPGTGLGHQEHQPSRLRAIEMLEGPSPLGQNLYRRRTEIERAFGHASNFGGGLQPLPSWVRRPHRVVPWVATKLLLNALRLAQIQALAA